MKRSRFVRKLRTFYRLNKEMFDPKGYYFAVLRKPVDDWREFEQRLRKIL